MSNQNQLNSEYRDRPHEIDQGETSFLSLFFKLWKSGLILFSFLTSLAYPFLNWQGGITLRELIDEIGSREKNLLFFIIGIELLLTGIFLFSIYRIKKRIIKNESKFKGIIKFNIILFLMLWFFSFFIFFSRFIYPQIIVMLLLVVLLFSIIPSVMHSRFYQNKKFFHIIFGVFILLIMGAGALNVWGIVNCDFYSVPSCVGQKALKTHNIFLCQKANRGPSDELWCYRAARAEVIKSKDVNICQKIKESFLGNVDDIFADCINNVVKNTNNPLLCEELDFSATRNECYAFASLNEKQNDITICDKISRGETEALYTLCVLNIAAGTQNFNFCNKIQDLKSKNKCFYEIAKQTNDPVLCEKITQSNVYNDCYANIAKNVNNPSLCEKIIPFKNDKDHCYNQFNNEKIKSEHE